MDTNVKAPRPILLWVLVLLAQLFLALLLTGPGGNLANYTYRRQERAAALQAYSQDRTPEKLAAYQEEMRLARKRFGREKSIQLAMFFSCFLVLDAVYIYWTHYGQRKQAVV